MTLVTEVSVAARDIADLRALVPADAFTRMVGSLGEVRDELDGATLWEVNSTATGGGVAEMLQFLVAYQKGFGIDSRWAVLQGDAEFFRITKRLHHALHGSAGDGSPLGAVEQARYQDTVGRNAREFLGMVRPGDRVLLHDPQTAALAPYLSERGCHVVWRCHIGHDQHNEHVAAGWDFLAPSLASVERLIFTRADYVPGALAGDRVRIITPCIDPMSPKNQALPPDEAIRILQTEGVLGGVQPRPGTATFHREDGSVSPVTHAAEILTCGTLPLPSDPLVTQVSRWDGLKDPIGVMHGFVHALGDDGLGGAHLLLAGPSCASVQDDPEGLETYEGVVAAWRALPEDARSRVHLASLPMDDREENAAIVDAVQSHAAVVVQKSLHEGFGLTVTEAMWKAKPVVATAVGGIRDQIDHGVDGLLVDDPTDRDAFAAALRRAVLDVPGARDLGLRAKAKVAEHFLMDRYHERLARILREISTGTAVEPVRPAGGAVRAARLE